MGRRSANYKVSVGAADVLSDEQIEDAVKAIVDQAYRENIIITGTLLRRDKIVGKGGGVVDQVTILTEENGVDCVEVVLVSDLKAVHAEIGLPEEWLPILEEDET